MGCCPLLLLLLLALSASSVGEAATLRAGAMFGGGEGGARRAEPGGREGERVTENRSFGFTIKGGRHEDQ